MYIQGETLINLSYLILSYLILSYKFQHNILPLSTIISQLHLYAKKFSIHNHITRSKDVLKISLDSDVDTRTFSNVSARIWNILLSKINYK